MGTIDSFFDAHQDLISTLPIFNLYNMEWPIHSQTVNSPPAKFVRDSVGRMGNAIDSIVSLGSVLSGTHLERSVVGPWTLAGGGSTITDSVLFDHVRVGRGCTGASRDPRQERRPRTTARRSASTESATSPAVSP